MQPLKFFEAPPLETWSIIYCESDESLAQKFLLTLTESLCTFNYHHKPPTMVKVPSVSLSDWQDALKKNLSTHVIACFLLIPGVRGAPNPLYSQVKRLLIEDIPVPSQVILTGTIERSKSALFSVTNKLLIQMCAKLGGEPWAL